MYAVQHISSNGVLIATVVGVFGLLQVWVSRKTGKEATKVAEKAVDVSRETATAVSTKATSHGELVLAKLDRVQSHLKETNAKIEVNRIIARRDVAEIGEKIGGLTDGQKTLFELLVDLDDKVTNKGRTPKPIRVVAGD